MFDYLLIIKRRPFAVNMATFTRSLVFLALLLATSVHARKDKFTVNGADDILCFEGIANAGKEVPPLPKTIKATGQFVMCARGI